MPEATIPDPRTRSVILKALIIAEAKVQELERRLSVAEQDMADMSEIHRKQTRQLERAGQKIIKLKAKNKKLKA